MTLPLAPAPVSSADRIVRRVAVVLLGVALLAFVVYLLIYFRYALALFRFPFDYDQGEGFELLDTVLFSRGQWPYQDANQYPFYSSNYPPVFHLVIVPLVWLFGPQYWTGRLVSFLGTLITAAAIGYAVQREGRRWWLSSFAGLAFLASNYVYHVGPLFRQHMFMVMFETLAVVGAALVMSREEREGRPFRRGWLAVSGPAAACRLYEAAGLCHRGRRLSLLLPAPVAARHRLGPALRRRHRPHFSLAQCRHRRPMVV